MRRLVLIATGLVTACGFEHGQLSEMQAPVPDAPLPLPPVMCGDLTCDPHSVCTEASTGASCACATGYSGDGMTCTAIDPCATNNGGCAAACDMTGPGTFACYTPQSCADVAAHTTLINDSTVTLYAGGNVSQPWTAFCHGGHEFITPTNTTTNFAQYTQSSKSPGTNVRTTYTRLRIDPATLKIDICDMTYATSTGMLMHDPANNGNMPVTSMPLGVAMDCAASSAPTKSGVAGVDLRGAPFAVTTATTWAFGGNSTSGDVTRTNGDQTIAITGGGNCGWNAPAGAPNNPFNTCTNLKLITLQYAP